MSCRVLSGNLVLVVSLLCPLQYCERIETDDWSSRVSFYITRRPIPWDKITVPNLLSPEVDADNSDYESFKTFVYVLFSITLVVGLYYFLKCCKCTKVCGNTLCGTRPIRQPSRLAAHIERRSQHRTARRMRRYQRINTPELHASSDRSRTPSRPTGAETRLIKSDKPPDYLTVVLEDMEAKQTVRLEERPETPPPSYDENIFK